MIRISEIFGPTIQGEGALIGKPTVFVRTGGCDYRCSWCDTIHAVDPAFRHSWQPMPAREILARVDQLTQGRPILVTLSGGNPALQPLAPLIQMGQASGHRFALETQGSIAQDWFGMLDVLTLSPKPPSSSHKMAPEKLDACLASAGAHTQVSLKFVVFNDEDFAFARHVASRHAHVPVYLQPGNLQVPAQDRLEPEVDQAVLAKRLEQLIEWSARAHWHEVTILPQLHVLLWGNKRGV